MSAVRIRYLTQLNTKPRILKWYTPMELIFVMFASFIPFVAEIILGLTPNLFLVLLLWMIFTFIIVFFRLGKPDGYLVHLITSLYTPQEFRVGAEPHSGRKYPIAERPQDRKYE